MHNYAITVYYYMNMLSYINNVTIFSNYTLVTCYKFQVPFPLFITHDGKHFKCSRLT